MFNTQFNWNLKEYLNILNKKMNQNVTSLNHYIICPMVRIHIIRLGRSDHNENL